MDERPILLAGYQPPRSVHTRAGRRLASALEALTGGRLTVGFVEDVTAAGAPMSALPGRVADGEFDVFYIASSYLAGTCPSLAALDAPFPQTPKAALFAALRTGAPGRALAEEIGARTPFRLLGFWDNGSRHVSNAVRPILRPSDCAGLRLRTLDNDLHAAMFRAMGFEPVFVDVRDFPRAVAGGIVDAQENPLANFVAFRVNEHHRRLSLTAHFQGVALLLANARWWASIPAGSRSRIEEAVDIASACQSRWAMEEESRCLDLLRSGGTEIVPAEQIDVAAFRDLARAVFSEAIGAASPALRPLLD